MEVHSLPPVIVEKEGHVEVECINSDNDADLNDAVCSSRESPRKNLVVSKDLNDKEQVDDVLQKESEQSSEEAPF